MAEQAYRDEIAQLRAEIDSQRAITDALHADLACFKCRRRLLRRVLPLILAALLVTLVPLATLATTPFNDLVPGSVHNANIDAVYNAGITVGCDPNVRYCLVDLVTRQEKASFLARTAGLGGNAPVANAKTAVTAQNATSATNATNATHATAADTAVNATNAAQLDGKPTSAYLPATGDMIIRFPGVSAVGQAGTTVFADPYGGTNVQFTGRSGTVIVPLPRPATLFGIALALKSVRICYTADANAHITSSSLYANERGSSEDTTIVTDPTARAATTATCFDLAVSPTRAIAGQTYFFLILNSSAPGGSVTLHSFALTLTPLGTATEEPSVRDTNAPAKP